MTEESDAVDYFMSIPLIIRSSSVEREDGTWVRRLECDEFPECVVESESITEAFDALEWKRKELTKEILEQGGTPPEVRAPVRARPRVNGSEVGA